MKIVGLAIANGLVSLAGSVFCQEERVFEISMGTGAIVIGLASVIIGTSLFKKLTLLKATSAVLIGSVVYKACVAIALRNFEPQAMKLITAVLFLAILVLGMERRKEGEDGCWSLSISTNITIRAQSMRSVCFRILT